MFQLIKSVLKSIELHLTLKNKKFYYDLHKEFKDREQKLVELFLGILVPTNCVLRVRVHLRLVLGAQLELRPIRRKQQQM